MKRALFVALLLASNTGVAQEVMPTDADLRSAYCITVVKEQLVFMHDATTTAQKGATSFPPDVAAARPDLKKQADDALDVLRTQEAKFRATLNRLQPIFSPS